MGRPKGSKNKKTKKNKKTVKSVKKKVGRPKKAKRGRPKGSTNKNKKKKVIKKKVGRPKKIEAVVEKVPVKKYSKYLNLPDDYVEPVNQKFVGYCPKCDMCLTTKDISKGIYECVGCGSKRNKKYLKKESKAQIEKEKISKAQYLKETATLIKQKKSESDVHISDLPDISIMNDVKD